MTLEEILAEAKTNEVLRKALVVSVSEFDEGKELLTNHAKAHFDANIGTKISEIYTNLDNDIFDVIGVRKKAEQKTYDFLKNDVLGELKALKSKSAEGSDDEKAKKIKDLEGQVKTLTESTKNSEFWHDTHHKALASWETEKTELNNKITTIEKDNVSNVVNTDLTMGLSSLEFNPNIPKSAVDALTNTIKNDVIKSAKVESGKIIYLKADGTPWLDKEYKPITAKGIFAEQLGDVLKTASSGGGGADPNNTGGITKVEIGGKSTNKAVLNKEKFNTRVGFFEEVEKTLIEGGIEKNSTEWNSMRDEAYKEYEVEKLPRV